MRPWSLCADNVTYDRLEKSHCKVAILGDRGCGKTTMIHSLGAQIMKQGGPFSTYKMAVDLQGHPGVLLEILDFPGDTFTVEHGLPCDADIIILCVDVSRPETLDSITTRWIRLVRKVCPSQHVFMVGCKTDLLNDLETIQRLAECRQIPITYAEASLISCLIGARAYVEVRALQYAPSCHLLIDAIARQHAGKLNSSHIVFKRQRSAAKHRSDSNQSLKDASSLRCFSPTGSKSSFSCQIS